MVYQKTSIRFGLINFDVELETIRKTENTLSFEGISECCKATTNAKKFCSVCGKEQKWNSDLKGYKISKNEKVILNKEELEALDNQIDTEIADMVSVPTSPEHFYKFILVCIERSRKMTIQNVLINIIDVKKKEFKRKTDRKSVV
jgi:hypothetical protein